MCGRALFIVYIATFILTWPDHFAVSGTPKTRSQLCKELGYKFACTFKEKSNLCQVLTCGYSGTSYYNLHRYISQPIILRNGVPDDTECGESKICRSGKCVAVRSMPHYRSRLHYVSCSRSRRGAYEPVPTRRQQCQRLGFDVACSDADNSAPTSCTSLKCGYKASDGSFFYQPYKTPITSVVHPLTGTRCGSNGVCLKNKCVPLNEWSSSKPRPTYTGQEHWDTCRTVRN